MAGSFANFYENALAAYLGAQTALPTIPASFYLALFTAGDGEASLTEVSGGSYARQAVARSAGGLTVSNNTFQNAATITFPQATADWGTVTKCAFMDASSGGNPIMWADLTASRTVNTGGQLIFDAGQITVTID